MIIRQWLLIMKELNKFSKDNVGYDQSDEEITSLEIGSEENTNDIDKISVNEEGNLINSEDKDVNGVTIGQRDSEGYYKKGPVKVLISKDILYI